MLKMMLVIGAAVTAALVLLFWGIARSPVAKLLSEAGAWPAGSGDAEAVRLLENLASAPASHPQALRDRNQHAQRVCRWHEPGTRRGGSDARRAETAGSAASSKAFSPTSFRTSAIATSAEHNRRFGDSVPAHPLPDVPA